MQLYCSWRVEMKRDIMEKFCDWPEYEVGAFQGRALRRFLSSWRAGLLQIWVWRRRGGG
jgi:hypothetical protein